AAADLVEGDRERLPALEPDEREVIHVARGTKNVSGYLVGPDRQFGSREGAGEVARFRDEGRVGRAQRGRGAAGRSQESLGDQLRSLAHGVWLPFCAAA